METSLAATSERWYFKLLVINVTEEKHIFVIFNMGRLISLIQQMEEHMALEMRQLTMNFDATSGIVQEQQATAVFSARVEKAEAMLKGFDIRYTNGDHHVLQQRIDLDVIAINNNTVTISSQFLLRDSSGNIDDPFRGFVQAVVIADTAASPPT
jgi:hypothetical protein